MSDEPEHAAREALDAAIRDYYSVIAPDVYVEGWVLLTHKRSPEWEREDTSAVGGLTGIGQSWLTTRALIDVARQRDVDELRKSNDSD